MSGPVRLAVLKPHRHNARRITWSSGLPRWSVSIATAHDLAWTRLSTAALGIEDSRKFVRQVVRDFR
jgi:hypothetical protein